MLWVNASLACPRLNSRIKYLSQLAVTYSRSAESETCCGRFSACGLTATSHASRYTWLCDKLPLSGIKSQVSHVSKHHSLTTQFASSGSSFRAPRGLTVCFASWTQGRASSWILMPSRRYQATIGARRLFPVKTLYAMPNVS